MRYACQLPHLVSHGASRMNLSQRNEGSQNVRHEVSFWTDLTEEEFKSYQTYGKVIFHTRYCNPTIALKAVLKDLASLLGLS